MGQKIILLADDDSDDTEMFCEALESIDAQLVCDTAVNGAELLRKLDALKERPDLIFLDLNMPVMNGWECLKAIKANEHYKNIPVIMISTSSHSKEIATAAALGALCYFVKPHSFNELIEVLQVLTSNLGPGLKNAIANMKMAGSKNILACAED